MDYAREKAQEGLHVYLQPLLQPAPRDFRQDMRLTLGRLCPPRYFSARVAVRMGAQRATSERKKRSNAVGLRSAFTGVEPPS